MTTPINITSTPNPDQQQQQQQNPQIQPFPQPQAFTFLPQLYTLISRLAPLQAPSTNGQASLSTTTGSRTSRSPTLTRRPAPAATSTATDQANDNSAGGSTTLTQSRSRDEAIDIKDLPALVYPLRQQIERAKEIVRALPDVGRSVEEQEREMGELRARIGGLKGRLRELGDVAGRVGGKGKDVVMTGVEG